MASWIQGRVGEGKKETGGKGVEGYVADPKVEEVATLHITEAEIKLS